MKLEDQRYWLRASIKEVKRRANRIVLDNGGYDGSAAELAKDARAVLAALERTNV